METAAVEERLVKWRDIVEKRLKELTAPRDGSPYNAIVEPVRYSLLNAGKRVRPALTLEFCAACGGDPMTALDSACAVEMIHTYSLIHDDLPCMDNDDFRRGKPSCHKVFGEAEALLAGDALLNYAGMTISGCTTAPADRLLKAGGVLAELSGPFGMIGGQMLDIESEGKTVGVDRLRDLVIGKTCALIESACLIGCVIAGADDEKKKAAQTYGRELGMAFQIIDDILDVIGDEKTLGKPIASDEQNGKTTWASLMGVDGARRMAELHTENAVSALADFGAEADFLRAFAVYLLSRIS